jgi:hypothetical protein
MKVQNMARAIAAVVLCAAVSCTGARERTIHLTGDSTAAGAEVLVDGASWGHLVRRVKTPDPGAVGPRDTVYVGEFLEVSRGRHTVSIVTVDGDTLDYVVDAKWDTYLYLSDTADVRRPAGPDRASPNAPGHVGRSGR